MLFHSVFILNAQPNCVIARGVTSCAAIALVTSRKGIELCQVNNIHGSEITEVMSVAFISEEGSCYEEEFSF
jgi:hypothetical protein